MEAVILSIPNSYIVALSDNKEHKQRLKQLKDNIDQALSSILILNTFAHTMGATGVGAEAVRLFGIEWQSLFALVLTLLILYVSEIIPKTIGSTYWRALAKPSAYLICILMRLLAPLIWLSSLITQRIKKNKPQGTTREEIFAMAEIGEESGILEEKEGQLIENILHLKQIKVKEILTPRAVVYSLDCDQSIESSLMNDNMFIYSRIPVYKGMSDNIVGVVFAREILKTKSLDGKTEQPIKKLVKPVFIVSENIPVYYLIDLFIKRKEHLFVVNDSYEQFLGIVTLEDAIETLLGVEIVDEADQFIDMQQLAREKAEHWKHKHRPKIIS